MKDIFAEWTSPKMYKRCGVLLNLISKFRTYIKQKMIRPYHKSIYLPHFKDKILTFRVYKRNLQKKKNGEPEWKLFRGKKNDISYQRSWAELQNVPQWHIILLLLYPVQGHSDPPLCPLKQEISYVKDILPEPGGRETFL